MHPPRVYDVYCNQSNTFAVQASDQMKSAFPKDSEIRWFHVKHYHWVVLFQHCFDQISLMASLHGLDVFRLYLTRMGMPCRRWLLQNSFRPKKPHLCQIDQIELVLECYSSVSAGGRRSLKKSGGWQLAVLEAGPAAVWAHSRGSQTLQVLSQRRLP